MLRSRRRRDPQQVIARALPLERRINRSGVLFLVAAQPQPTTVEQGEPVEPRQGLIPKGCHERRGVLAPKNARQSSILAVTTRKPNANKNQNYGADDEFPPAA